MEEVDEAVDAGLQPPAMTSTIVEYAEAGAPIRVESDAILVNSSKIDVLEPASDDDLGLARTIELQRARDPGAKDMTASA